eukprot:UN19257
MTNCLCDNDPTTSDELNLVFGNQTEIIVEEVSPATPRSPTPGSENSIGNIQINDIPVISQLNLHTERAEGEEDHNR